MGFEDIMGMSTKPAQGATVPSMPVYQPQGGQIGAVTPVQVQPIATDQPDNSLAEFAGSIGKLGMGVYGKINRGMQQRKQRAASGGQMANFAFETAKARSNRTAGIDMASNKRTQNATSKTGGVDGF